MREINDEDKAMKMDMRAKNQKIGTKQNENKSNRSEILRIGTWNIRSSYEEGALKGLTEIANQLQIQILLLQETKLKGTEITKVDDYTFFKSGSTNNRYFGNGFLVNKTWSDKVVDFKPISDRLCLLRLRGKYRKISIINVHAPTEEKSIEEKDMFYEEIAKTIDSVKKYDIKIIAGDFNAKVGREEDYRNITGNKSFHEKSNENGKKLIQLAMEYNMKIVSTSFQHKDIHKITWVAPDGRTRNQIDHVLIENKHARNVNDVRSYRGADINSDHFLVIMKMKQAIPSVPKEKPNKIKKFNVSKLSEESVRKKYQKTIADKLEVEIHREDDIMEKWDLLQKTVTEAAKEILGDPIKNRRENWYNEECKKACQERNEARLKLLQNWTNENQTLFKEKRALAKKICRKYKRLEMENKLINLEEQYKNKEIRNFYQEAKKCKQKNGGAMQYCRNEEGELVGEASEKTEVWAQHFEKLLKTEDDEQNGLLFESTIDQIPTEPSREEIEEVTRNLANNKSPGENGISAELLKEGGPTVMKFITNIIQEVWKQEKMPNCWNDAIICPIFKKGDKTLCSNYRGISLLDVTYKVLSKIIRTRLDVFSNEIIGEYQGGFRAGRGTTDQIFVIKQIQSSTYDQGLSLHMLFIDFQQAYDKIRRAKIYEAMEQLGIPNKIIRLVQMTLKDTRSRVAIGGNLSRHIAVNTGLKQGDPLSTSLFNIVLEVLIRQSELQTKGTIFHHKHQCIAYADDVLLLTRSKEELKRIFIKFEKNAKKYGLKINETKTKYMVMGNSKTKGNLQITTEGENSYCFEQVNQSEYLGVILTNNNNEQPEIEKRIGRGCRAAGIMKELFKSKNVSLGAKLRIYNTVICPAVLYGCELWVLNQQEANKLEIWERRILRGIFGGIKDSDGLWRRRTNKEIREMYGKPTITQKIRKQRASWLGHVVRMNKNRMPKLLLESLGGKKKRGRPKKKWLEAVLSDLRKVGVVKWKQKAENRTDWNRILRNVEEFEY